MMIDDRSSAMETRLRDAFAAKAATVTHELLVTDRPDGAAGFSSANAGRLRRGTLGAVLVAAAVVALIAGGGAVVINASRHHESPATPPPTHHVSPPPTASRPTTAATSHSAGHAHTSSVEPKGGPVPAGFVPYSATFVSPTAGWVLGNAPCSSAPCTSIVRTRDGGKTWQGIPAPRTPIFNGQQGVGVNVLHFADPLDGWAAGDQLWATHNGGASWHKITLSCGGQVANVETAAGIAYALCAEPTASLVYATGILSDHWRRVLAASRVLSPSALTVKGREWFLATVGGIYHGAGTCLGSNLCIGIPTTLTDPCPSAGTAAGVPLLAVADATHLDAVCMLQGAAGTAQFQLYGTTDRGRHWTKSGGTHLAPSGLDVIDDNGNGVLLLAATAGNSVLQRTTNDGASFTTPLTVNGASAGWSDMGFTTTTQAIAVLRNQAFYISHDAGVTWTRVRF
jgi:photosystem II stability/assembly factor-like uncharacterized protein